jgi:hypothetical protein
LSVGEVNDLKADLTRARNYLAMIKHATADMGHADGSEHENAHSLARIGLGEVPEPPTVAAVVEGGE